MFPDFLKTKEKLQKMLDQRNAESSFIAIWDRLPMFVHQ